MNVDHCPANESDVAAAVPKFKEDTEKSPSLEFKPEPERRPSNAGTTYESLYALRKGVIPTPVCDGLEELPHAAAERARFNELLSPTNSTRHLEYGLALTVGSAVGNEPPCIDCCLAAFLVANKERLTAGARAWTKHCHRSERPSDDVLSGTIEGWWDKPKGPVDVINAKALALFWKIMKAATWRNLHWLPHQILVYEVRIKAGYGMRWSQDLSPGGGDHVWSFRGYVEPMMENGHERGWKH
ncbi:hypothetical protein BD410DRAFT_453445 [Rickenella mellea]|uniref:Uncharacterized protein n=1 Tax=Rickenella mellea TaxID=50990 RepID=A0A4Y7PV53_9AGAM|nr:hypothetical protein BD410DRAFT_453445 [Rickenella mellea]